MNRIRISLLILSAVFPLTALPQWYVGATAGQYDLDESGWESSALLSTRGGYKFNDVLSIEASYTFFTETENEYYDTLEGGLIDIGLVGTIPLSKKFEIFGRVGYGYWAADINDYGYNSDDTGDAWNYGGGLAFNINKNFTLFAGYQKYEFDSDYVDDLKADTVYAGLKFYFDFSSDPEGATTQSSAGSHGQQPPPESFVQLQAVDSTGKSECILIKTVTTGSGGPGDPSAHKENAMRKALISAADAGADSYYVVDIKTADTGASVVLEALDCK